MKKKAASKLAPSEVMELLDRHFAVCSAAAVGVVGLMCSAEDAKAEIVYSGLVNIPIFPVAINGGVYIDLENPANFAQGSRPAGWDINPYFSGQSIYLNGNTRVALNGGGAPDNLTPGTLVGPALTFSGVSFYGSVAIPANQTGYIGFSFDPDMVPGAQTLYGWYRISVGDNVLGDGAISEWAFDNSGAPITVGAVPEPSSIALLAMGAAGVLALRRRRRKA